MPFSSHDNPSLALLPVFFLKTKSDHILLLPKTIQWFILSTTSFSWYQIPSQSDYNPHSSQWCLNTHTTLATYSLDSPLVPECLRPFHHFILFTLHGILSSTSSTGKVILTFQYLAEMSPFSVKPWKEGSSSSMLPQPWVLFSCSTEGQALNLQEHTHTDSPKFPMCLANG